MRTDTKELLAVGILGSKSRIGERIEAMLSRGRTFSSRASIAGVAAGAVALAALLFAGSFTPRWIAFAQQLRPVNRQSFELASIKPCRTGGRADTKKGPAGGFPTVSPGRLNTGCAALAANYPFAGLIQRAYDGLGLGRLPLGSALPVSGGPAWIYSDYYEINAKAADRADEKTMEGPMLQALLEDRFKLRVRHAARQVPVYALIVVKSGAKLQPADPTCTVRDGSVFPVPPPPPGKKYCDDGVVGRKGANTFLRAEPANIHYFCKLLGLALDRPVIDRTGLKGTYGFNLEFAVDQSTPGVIDAFGPPSANEPSAASIFTVIQEQLGLKLEPVIGPRQFLVVDHVEQPSGN